MPVLHPEDYHAMLVIAADHRDHAWVVLTVASFFWKLINNPLVTWSAEQYLPVPKGKLQYNSLT